MTTEAVVKVYYNCGCAFKTTDLVEAVTHASETGHQLSVIGTIKPNKGA